MLLWPGVSVAIRRPELVFYFGLMGALMLSFLGLLTSLWAEKFDHAAAVTNFVVTPLSLLSGTFYSVHQLSPAFQTVSHANPFFYVISGSAPDSSASAIRRCWPAESRCSRSTSCFGRSAIRF